MRRNLPSACTAQRGSVCQSTQVVQKLYKRLYKKPHELPSFRFLWPCIVSKIWREKTNKLQQLDVYLSNKNQLDATLCSFYFCGVTLHVSAASAHHQEYLKLVQRLLVHVLLLQVSHHITLLGPELNACWEYLPNTHSVPALIRRCDDLPATM